jgi:hypothetical protein
MAKIVLRARTLEIDGYEICKWEQNSAGEGLWYNGRQVCGTCQTPKSRDQIKLTLLSCAGIDTEPPYSAYQHAGIPTIRETMAWLRKADFYFEREGRSSYFD